jgi:hypothetical protein
MFPNAPPAPTGNCLADRGNRVTMVINAELTRKNQNTDELRGLGDVTDLAERSLRRPKSVVSAVTRNELLQIRRNG